MSSVRAIFLQDYEALSVIPWRVVVVDEAHRLRTDGNKLTGCLREILAKGEVEYEGFQLRLLMTGTPLQNNTAELWSLLNFIEPRKFPDLAKFQERFGNMSSREQVGFQEEESSYCPTTKHRKLYHCINDAIS